jgi:hypothetical protein
MRIAPSRRIVSPLRYGFSSVYDLEQALQVDATEERLTAVIDGSLSLDDLLVDHFVRETHRQRGEISGLSGPPSASPRGSRGIAQAATAGRVPIRTGLGHPELLHIRYSCSTLVRIPDHERRPGQALREQSRGVSRSGTGPCTARALHGRRLGAGDGGPS